MSELISNTDLISAFQAAMTPQTPEDVKHISAVAPQLILDGKACAAFFLATAPTKNRANWMAENLALFNTKGLSQKQRSDMIHATFPSKRPISAANISSLARSAARVGRIGFSFPIWRFVSQGFGEDKKALLEHYGMQRLRRDNDIRDASLPFSNPQRDEWGSGFFWSVGHVSIEYRRAYVACSIHDPMRPVTLVIRNSSYFYGRDRMPEAAYISFAYKTPAQLKKLTLEDLTSARSNFAPIQNILHMPAIPSNKARLDSLRDVLNTLDEFDNRLSLWLGSIGKMPKNHDVWIDAGTPKNGGLPLLLEFMKETLQNSRERGSDKAPLYLGRIHKDRPAWAPIETMPLNESMVQQLQDYLKANKGKSVQPDSAYMKDSRHVLLSGAHGDFPLGPKYSAEIAKKQTSRRAKLSPPS